MKIHSRAWGAGTLYGLIVFTGMAYPANQSGIDSISDPQASTIIIFDIGGILADYNKKAIIKKMIKDVGIVHLAGQWLENASVLSKQHLYTMMNQVLDDIAAAYYPEHLPIGYTAEGEPFGRGMCAWQAGRITSSTLNDELPLALDRLQKNGIIRTDRERIIIESTIRHSIIDSQTLVESHYPLKDGVALLKALKQNPANRIVILSNFAPEQFKKLQEQPQMRTIFDLCDDIFYSGMELYDGTQLGIKPALDTFEFVIRYCEEKYRINRTDGTIFFIDNQPENTVAARLCGINGMLVNASYHTDLIPSMTFTECAHYCAEKGLLQEDNQNVAADDALRLIQKALNQQNPLLITITAGCICGIILWQHRCINATGSQKVPL